jgi:hypothetical protein
MALLVPQPMAEESSHAEPASSAARIIGDQAEQLTPSSNWQERGS